MGGTTSRPGAAKTAKSSGMIPKTAQRSHFGANTVRTGSHVFEISGYSMHRDHEVRGLLSDVFNIGGYDWKIQFFPGGVNEPSKDYVSVYVHLHSKNNTQTRVRASFQLSLVDVTGSSPPYTKTTQTNEFGPGSRNKCVGLAEFKKRNELEESPYLRDDRLTIECHAFITLVNHVRSLDEVPPSDIAEHLGKLLQEKQDADVVFVVEGQEFPAHKMVLAMRSPVFKAELYGGMRESDTGHITIGDMQPAVFEALLHFIYTDSLPVMDDLDRENYKEIIRHLLVAADCYAMERLKIMCESILCNNIDVKTVVTTLVLAELHDCARLHDACVWSGKQGARNAPGPPKQLPVLGNLLQLGSRPHRYFQAVARKYGPVVQVQLGRVRMVVVASPEAAKEVLRANDLHCCSRPNSPGKCTDAELQLPGRGIRPLQRLLARDAEAPGRGAAEHEARQSFAYARAAEVDRLVDSLAAAPPAIPVNLSEKLYALSDGIIGTVAFGKMYGSASFERSSFQTMMDETLRVLGSFTFEDFFPSSALARWADVLTGAAPRRRRVFRKIDAFFDAVIDMHLKPERLAAGVQEDMVDALVKMWRDGYTGGIDTCAVTTIWIMSELMRNPRVMRKAQAEAAPAGDSADPERNHAELRDRCSYSVPAGTRIHVNVWAMGRDPDIWDGPEDFYPERFQDADVDFRGSHSELLPFGSGRRACPAIAMGVANVEFVLANLLYCFDWELPEVVKEEDIDMEETGQLVFRKKVPLLVVPVKH
ncbi:hypothetical protein ACQ4PT_038408 [Festuca glaucescens]